MDELSRSAEWTCLSLEERRALFPDSALPAQATSRIPYWQQRGDLEASTVFARRLSAAAMDAQQFGALISRTAPGQSTQAPPGSSWVKTFHAAVETLPEERNAVISLFLPGIREHLPFLPILAPFMALGMRACAAAASEQVRRSIAVSLAGRFHRAAMRTLVLRLNVGRVMGTLEGSTPEERFQSFLSQPVERLKELLQSHPMLVRVLSETTERFSVGIQEVLTRVAQDTPELIRVGLLPPDPGPLVNLEHGLSDPHGGNRTVSRLTFGSGRQLIYKPRPIAVDVRFNELLAVLNEAGFTTPMRVLNHLERPHYGYVEHASPSACEDSAQARRFYHRQGGFMALLYLLRGIDFHSENVIACGEHPVLVDVECLFHPSPGMFERASTEPYLARRISETVMASGLLPIHLVGEAGVADIGGMGGRNGQLFPRLGPGWAQQGTDEMRFEWRSTPMPDTDNVPMLGERPAAVSEHIDELVAGFEEMYRLILARWPTLSRPGGPLRAFAEVPVRLLVRSTSAYSTLSFAATHPDHLLSGADRDLAFEPLWAMPESEEFPDVIIQAEIEALREDDIPQFRFHPGSTDVWDAYGRKYPDLLRAATLTQVLEGISGKGEDDLRLQVHFIRNALLASALSAEPNAIPVDSRSVHATRRGLARELSPAEPAALISAAEKLGDRLIWLALREGGAATWMGFIPLKHGHWTYRATGSDFYGGSAGVALFLGQLALVTGKARYLDAALEGIEVIRRRWLGKARLKAGQGGYSGLASEAYAVFRLGQQLGRDDLMRLAVDALPRSIESVPQDMALDLLSGCAGTAVVALRLHSRTQEPALLKLASACGQRLLAAFPLQHGALRFGDNPLLGGLSHGASGLAWAAAELHAATGDERLRAAALELMDYEESLWDEEAGNWRDLRAIGPQNPHGNASFVAWCHGAAGIGIAAFHLRRLLGGELSRRNLDRAVEGVLRKGWPENHSLCHGLLGNAEVMVLAERMSDARRFGALALADIEQRGTPRCGTQIDVEEPGLMTGLAGIGYQLLRIANPDTTPSVLDLSVAG